MINENNTQNPQPGGPDDARLVNEEKLRAERDAWYTAKYRRAPRSGVNPRTKIARLLERAHDLERRAFKCREDAAAISARLQRRGH
jgi:hypothetical protein